MKSLVLAVAMMSTATAFGDERVSYVEKEYVEYSVDASGKESAKVVKKMVPSVVTDPAEASPTPYEEIKRVLDLMPKPVVGFVDYGCGDARWCIEAAKKWGVRATGVEIDSGRAALARRRVKEAKLEHLVTIIEGDATTTDVQADVGVAYLYTEVLEKLRPRLEKLTTFASYLHQPPGLAATRNGDSWVYTKPVQQVTMVRNSTATWNGRQYTAPSCNSPRCEMCRSIREQLSTMVPVTTTATQQSSGGGHYVKYCSNGTCTMVWVPD